MKKTLSLIFIACLFQSCASLPQFFQSVEEIADNDAVELTMSKDAFQKDKNVNITIDIQNAPAK